MSTGPGETEGAVPDDGNAGRSVGGTTNDLSGTAGAVIQAGSIVGGVHLHPVQPDSTPPPHELPPDVHQFTDRIEHLAAMDLLLSSTEGTPTTAAAVISAVLGTAGVGKTAFVTHWAHRVADRFPDGQLYVNLRGYGLHSEVPPEEALADLLRSLGVASSDIPQERDARAARFRSLTAGRRMLIFLDNARSAEQVRPLLPGTASSLVVVTSRDALTGLVTRDGARRVNLDLLPEGQALALLRMLVGARIDEEPQAARTLVEQCARLPLALRITAELANSSPDVPLAELVADLTDVQTRLDLLDAGDDPYTAVRSVFSWSYRSLGPDEARTLRLLGLHPGREFDPASVAVLVDTDPRQARRLLDSLVRAHLVERTVARRYQMHDLLRVYAADLASLEEPQEEQAAALQRLFDYFLRSASLAMDSIFPQEKGRRPSIPATAGPPPIEFAAIDQAIQWLEAERATLLSVAARTAQTSWAAYATALSTTLYRFLDVYGYFDDAVTLHSSAVQAARHLKEAAELSDDPGAGAFAGEARVAEARALDNLGTVYQRLGRYHEAVTSLREALSAAQEAGVAAKEVTAFALSDLSLAELLLGELEPALANLEQALRLFRELEDRTGQGSALNNMGLALKRLSRLDESLDRIQQSLVLFQATEDGPRQGYALNDIGVILTMLDRYDEARQHHEEALTIARDTGDRALEAAALNGLGSAGLRRGTPESVRELHGEALVIATSIGDRYEQAQALEGLAALDESLSQLDAARQSWRQALLIYTELGAPEAEQVSRHLAGPAGT
jgi:tetratricopeptide (TPR) repeat protein